MQFRDNQGSSRLKGRLQIITPGIVVGVLVGSMCALLVPSLVSITSRIRVNVAGFPATKLGHSIDPWVKAIVAPSHLMWIVLACAIAFLYLVHHALWLFLKRFYFWLIYEGTFVSAICVFTIWTQSFWWALMALVAGIFLLCAIAWNRFRPGDDPDHLISSDRPIIRLAEDRLDRSKLIVSLVDRLLKDSASIVALIGAYGDGKTSILNCLDEALQAQKVPVVRFKSSLPGDDLTLISTLFNSIGKQLRRRFFVRRLSNVLKRFARTFSGLVPSTSGLKDVFAEPSQKDELDELTESLDRLPVRRLVVLLDDMDRMQGNELRMLLKIIRAADDYPKLSFVCAFNKKALVDAFIRHQVMDRISMQFSAAAGQIKVQGALTGEQLADDTRAGYEYLEKFFPVQVPVPKLDESQLAKEFDLRFNQFAKRYGLPQEPRDTATFDKEFNPYWKSVFRPLLNNLRKMNTYFNALNSSFGLVKNEVNVIDFMFVELLRQSDPEIYEQVFRNRSLFYYPEWDLARWDERPETLSDEKEQAQYPKYEAMFRHLQGEDRDLTLSILSRLFPKIAGYTKDRLSRDSKLEEIDADKQKRIYHPYYFTIYFSLHVPEGYLGFEELEKIIDAANHKNGVAESQDYFSDYIQKQVPLKRYRFFEKTSRFEAGLQDDQAKGLANAVAIKSDVLQPDDLDIGEFRAATILILVLANRFRGTAEITNVLSDVIRLSAIDGFAVRLFQFASNKEHNQIFESWDHVDPAKLKAVLIQQLKAKYYKGGSESIYARGTWRDWQALVIWSREGVSEAANVQAYLKDEFQRRPKSIGKHVQWLVNSLGTVDGEKLVNDLFPLTDLMQMAKARGLEAHSTDSEKRAVEQVIQRYGSGSVPTTPSKSDPGAARAGGAR